MNNKMKLIVIVGAANDLTVFKEYKILAIIPTNATREQEMELLIRYENENPSKTIGVVNFT